jgi:hypothetical protein
VKFGKIFGPTSPVNKIRKTGKFSPEKFLDKISGRDAAIEPAKWDPY